MPDNLLIDVKGLWKRYGLPLPGWMAGMRDRVRVFRGEEPRRTSDGGPWALRDVNLTLKKGENLGLIGRNGAGKSTLLKVLAGVSPPTHGRVEMRGRLFPMIELNAGLHPDLSGRENIYLLGAIMGLERARMDERIGDILDFTELKEWIDRPVRKYSSGMLARLGFSVAVHAEADVILVDEVLGVGDFAFQKKCLARLDKMTSGGTSIILVSHNPYQVERLCDRVALLHEGRLEELDSAADVLHKYFQLGMESADAKTGAAVEPASHRPGTGDLRIDRVELFNGSGDSVTELRTGETARIRMHYRRHADVRDLNLGIRLLDSQNTLLLASDATRVRKSLEVFDAGWIDIELPALPVMPSVYTLQIKVVSDVLLDMVDNALNFNVTAAPDVLVDAGNKGLVYAEARWTCGEAAP